MRAQRLKQLKEVDGLICQHPRTATEYSEVQKQHGDKGLAAGLRSSAALPPRMATKLPVQRTPALWVAEETCSELPLEKGH